MEPKTPLKERLAEVEKQIVDIAAQIARQQEIVQSSKRLSAILAQQGTG